MSEYSDQTLDEEDDDEEEGAAKQQVKPVIRVYDARFKIPAQSNVG